MTGNQVQKIRESTELSVLELAEILGVRASSVYRWEAGGNKKSRIDGLPYKLLLWLGDFIEKDAKTVGRAFRTGGALSGLHKLVELAYKNA
jgi:transcriptional regulator with XRE-family HTH domain